MSVTEETPELFPARMVNEFVYCPRLFWLEYVEREFAESYDTIDGQRIHRRVDQASGELPDDITKMRSDATSVDLSSERLGLIAKIDLVRSEDGKAVPIDFKRGKQPSVEGGVDEPERVQVCIQALLLRENGYACDLGRIYYAASKTYIDVLAKQSEPCDREDSMRENGAADGGATSAALKDSPVSWFPDHWAAQKLSLQFAQSLCSRQSQEPADAPTILKRSALSQARREPPKPQPKPKTLYRVAAANPALHLRGSAQQKQRLGDIRRRGLAS